MITYLYDTLTPIVKAFRTPDRLTQASTELAEAERRLLVAHSGLDYAKAMVTYEAARVARLSQVLTPKQSTKDVAYARPAVQRVR